MYQIDVADTQDCLEVDEEFLTEVARRVLAEEQVVAAEISVALVDDATIHEINRQYLNHDYPTDVISFLLECDPPEGESPNKASEILRGQGKTIDGEVIISTEYAKKEAENFGWSPREEVVLYLVHGLLHLVGYDDLSSTEQQVMRTRERAMLALFQITPPQPSAAVQGENGPEPDSEPSEEPEKPPSGSPKSRRTES